MSNMPLYMYACILTYVTVIVQAQSTIQELFGRIRNIKEKAEHSEHMVQLTCLPYFQVILTHSVTNSSMTYNVCEIVDSVGEEDYE